MARQTHKNIVWSYINLGVGILAPLILIPLFTRFLGRQLYGEYVVITSLSYYLGLANLGLGQTIANRIAAAAANRDHAKVGTLVSTAFYSLTAVAGLLLIALLVLTPLLWSALVGRPDPGARFAFLSLFALSLIAFPLKAQDMMLRGYQRVDREQEVWASSSVIRVVVMATALFAGFKLAVVATIHGLIGLLSGLGTCLLAARLSPAARPRLADFSLRLLREMISPSIAFLVLQLSSALATRVDNVVIGYVLGAAPVTSYAVPFRLMLMAILLFTMVLNALQPTITAHYARDKRDLLRKAYSFFTRLALVYAVSAGVALWLVGPQFIRLWAGPGIYPGGLVFGLQVAFTSLQILLTPAETILWATSRHYIWATIALVEGGLNLGLSIWWAHRWGLAGVIGASIVARLVTNAWYLPLAASLTVGGSIRNALRQIAPGAGLAVIMVAAAGTLSMVAASVSIVASIGLAAGLLIPFAAAFAWLGFTAEERRLAVGWLWPAAIAEP
ncbi:MAG TPA: lipopolysaccharide biosynthesis protein [Candidatus Binataceae bacterium]|nr:lipopolysaccharide biosynthesis protein [Candidatus Binataceae bacterium]